MSNIIEALQWRYATKAYDTTKKVSAEDLNTILEAMRLAPSSFGLQPWKFIVVENPELRATLRGYSWDQPQITDASHIIVLCRKNIVTAADVDAYMQNISETRGMPVEQLDGFKQYVNGFIGNMDETAMSMRNTKQVYIALGTGLTAAAELKIDATPMEGFDASKYNEALGLTDYSAAVVLTVGYRSADDASANYVKVRYSKETLVEVK